MINEPIRKAGTIEGALEKALFPERYESGHNLAGDGVAKCQTLRAERDALKAENEKLREALCAFAEACRNSDDPKTRHASAFTNHRAALARASIWEKH